MSIKTPELVSDEPIGVSGFSYDDEAGDVQITFGDEVRVGVTLNPSKALALAEQIKLAADEAQQEV